MVEENKLQGTRTAKTGMTVEKNIVACESILQRSWKVMLPEINFWMSRWFLTWINLQLEFWNFFYENLSVTMICFYMSLFMPFLRTTKFIYLFIYLLLNIKHYFGSSGHLLFSLLYSSLDFLKCSLSWTEIDTHPIIIA